MKKVIIDTDIGTDVDDALALVYALKSKVLDIRAVTTVHGDTKIRGKIAKKICNLLNYNFIPVVAGFTKPLNSDKTFWVGFEGKDIDLNDVELEDTNVVDFLREIIFWNQGIEIISIAPSTNIAKLLQKYPEIKSFIGRIYVMNRGIEINNKFVLDEEAHNTKADIDATKIVFESGIPITVVTTEVCKKSHLTNEDFDKIKLIGNGLADILCKNAKEWLNFSKYNVAYLYDPLVIAVVEDSSIVSTKRLGNIDFTTDLNIDFKKYFLERVLG